MRILAPIGTRARGALRRMVRQIPYIRRITRERDDAVREAEQAKAEARRAWEAAGVFESDRSVIDYLCAIRLVKAAPDDIRLWLDLANLDPIRTRLAAEHGELMGNDALCRGERPLESLSAEIGAAMTEVLNTAAAALDNPADTALIARQVQIVVEGIVRWMNVLRCRNAHQGRLAYYAAAEEEMPWQWETFIAPALTDCDFTHVLDLACGHGRNTNILRKYAKRISLVDVNASCIDACRDRFGPSTEGCDVSYHVNSGCDLHMIEDASITLVFCWDAMIFFDRIVVRDYVSEFSRILKPGGRAFLHHSAIGEAYPHSDASGNPAQRSNMSAGIMRGLAEASGLTVVSQKNLPPVYPPKPGRFEDWWPAEVDCISVLERPRSRPTTPFVSLRSKP